jgi:hypothetical protein
MRCRRRQISEGKTGVGWIDCSIERCEVGSRSVRVVVPDMLMRAEY